MKRLVILILCCQLGSLYAQTQAQGIAINYTMPQGWQVVSEEYGTILLGHQTIPGILLIQEHGYNGQEMALTEMAEGVQEEGLLLQLTNGIRKLNNGDYFGSYTGVAQGQNVKAVGITSLSKLWQIGGVMVITMVQSDLYTKEHQNLAIALAQSIQYRPFMDAQSQQWATLVKGKMLVHSSSYSTGTTFTGDDGSYAGDNSVSMSNREEVHLCSNGQFSFNSNSNSSISMNGDAYGSFGGGGTDSGQNSSSGLWVLMNINNTPIFRLLYNDGTVEYHVVEDYQDGVLMIGGKRYVSGPSSLCQ